MSIPFKVGDVVRRTKAHPRHPSEFKAGTIGIVSEVGACSALLVSSPGRPLGGENHRYTPHDYAGLELVFKGQQPTTGISVVAQHAEDLNKLNDLGHDERIAGLLERLDEAIVDKDNAKKAREEQEAKAKADALAKQEELVRVFARRERRTYLEMLHQKATLTANLLLLIKGLEHGSAVARLEQEGNYETDHLDDMKALAKSLGYGIIRAASGDYFLTGGPKHEQS